MRIIKQDLQVYALQYKYWYIDWYENDRLHREDGPATMWNDEVKYYYLKGKRYFRYEEYWKKVHANY